MPKDLSAIYHQNNKERLQKQIISKVKYQDVL